MVTPIAARPAAPQSVDTLIVGAGQAGLATSHWLTPHGVEHQLLERREMLGGASQDRWGGFCLYSPNFLLPLPGMPYDGPAPEAFMPRDDMIGYLRDHAERIGAPVRTDADVTPYRARGGRRLHRGHHIHLRGLGRLGVRLHGHLEAADDGDLVFSDDLPERLGQVEATFYQRMKPMFDSCIAATGMPAPEPEPPRKDDWLPSELARLNLEAANVTSVLWATGYRLDFGVLGIPVLDEWNYPRHTAASPNTRACTRSGCRG